MLLMTLQQSLSSSHILSQFIGGNHGLHVADPGGQITMISQESVQLVGDVEGAFSEKQ